MDPYFTRNNGGRDQYGYRPEEEYPPSSTAVLLQSGGNKKVGSKSTVNLKWTTPPPTTTTTSVQPPSVYGVGGTGGSIDTTPAVSSSETTPVGRTATTPKGSHGAPRVSMPSLSQPTRLNLLDGGGDDSPNYFYSSSYGKSGGGLGSEGRVGKTTSGGLPVPSNVLGSGGAGGGYSSDRPFNPLKDTPKSYGSNGSDPAHSPLGNRDPFAEDDDVPAPDPFADSPNRVPSRRRGQTETRASPPVGVGNSGGSGPSRNSGNRSRSGTSPPVLEALSSSPTGLTGTDGDAGDLSAAVEDEWKDWYLATDGFWYKKDSAYFAAMNASGVGADDPQVHYPPAARGSHFGLHGDREDADNSSPYNPLLNDSIPGIAGVASGSFGGTAAQSPILQGGLSVPISPSSGSSQRPGGTLPTSAPGVNTSFVNSSMSSQQPGSPEEAKIRFRKIRDLGKGAFGEVFLAMNVMSGELIAVKQIQIDSGVSSKAIRDAKREVNVMVKLPDHPNCVRYIGFQEKEKYVHIIMEFVSGGSVESLLKMSKKRFFEPTIQQYAFMVLLGLQHLHDHHIVHQDIKGANVLIDPNGIAKIADFGCCKDLSAMHMNSSKTAGSPLFMAPEVCRGAPADTRSDVWSFGCLMLEMSKDDRTPWSGFEKMTIFAVIYAISTATTPPVIPSYLSPVCQDFISRCLQLDPDERATIAELLLHPFFTTAFEDEDCETGLMQDDSCDKATEESIMRLDRSGQQRTAEDVDSPPLRVGGGGGGDASPIRGQELAKPTLQNDESHYLMQFSLRSTGSNYDEDFTKKPSTNPLKKGKLAGGEGGLGSSLSSSPKLGSAGDGTPMGDLSVHGSPLLAVPVDGIPTLVPRGERDPLLTMRREGSEPVIYHSSGGGRIGTGAIGGGAGAESSTQLALVEYVAHSQRNRKKKGFFAKLADKFRCVSL